MAAKSSIIVEMSSDDAKLLRSFSKQIEAEKKRDQSLQKTAASADALAKKQGAQAKASTRAISQQRQMLTGLVASYAGAAAAVNLVTRAIRHMKQEGKDAINQVRALDDPRRGLRQISDGNPEVLRNLLQSSDQLALKLGSRDRGARLMFAAKSEGFEDFASDIARFDPIIKAESAATVAGQAPRLFQGSGLTARQAVAATFIGSGKSRANFEQIAAALPAAAEGTSLTGSSPAGTIAALSVLTDKFKSPETTADRLKSFGVALSLDPRFKGKGLLGGLDAVQALSETERKAFLGTSAERNVAFQRLSESETEIRKRRVLVQAGIESAGTASGPLERSLRAALIAQPNLKDELKLRRQEVKAEISKEGRANFGAATGRAAIEAEPGFGPVRFMKGLGADAAEMFHLGDTGTRIGGRTGAAAAGGLPALVLDILTQRRASELETAKETNTAARNLNEASNRLSNAVGGNAAALRSEASQAQE